MASPILIVFVVGLTWPWQLKLLPQSEAKPVRQCRTSCGEIPIKYPFGIDDGCGSPYYRRILVCTDSMELQLRTPSGRYPIKNISYSDPHLLVADPFQWTCRDGDRFRPARPFSLDTSTHFRLSPHNDYLFFNCSPSEVIMEPKPMFCERFPDQCDSACDTSSYLCRRLPGCSSPPRLSCCSYYPKGGESLRMMLRHCATYATVYWRDLGVTPAYNQIPEYGIRVDFDVPVTTRCLRCQDAAGAGAGTCGFDAETLDFSCLCRNGNSTTYCKDHNGHSRPAVVAVVSVAGVFTGAAVWYLRKMRTKAPVTHGVQTNENRLF
ncbi:uncharacterized protein LOC127240365 isoform X2 [Andrographis paniculata]|uniref:uncharacterized protein LOC127240365 isoform X2 n=1 Tax=Andrographis paniculata TaxID=175694 RepID=UPI0021E96012|nr:uncharacterized protein LOC127240365 isoform X2 [Andrographis paniculata]